MKKMIGFSISVLMAVALIKANNGSVPIFEQTTIDSPGVYLVTRDFTVASGNAITIDSNNVTLDLGGHAITCAGSDKGIYISNGISDFKVVNGRIIGGTTGVYAIAVHNLTVEKIHILNSSEYGIKVSDLENSIDIIDCKIIVDAPGYLSGNGIDLFTTSVHFTGTVHGNTVSGCGGNGISTFGMANGIISDNHITRFCRTNPFSGINVNSDLYSLNSQAETNRIEGNVILGDDSCLGNGLVVFCKGSLIKNNVVRNVGLDGFKIGQPDTLILTNIASGNQGNGFYIDSVNNTTMRLNQAFENGLTGIYLYSASYCYLLENMCVNNQGYGIFFEIYNSTYRDNFIKGNDTGAVSGGVDAGGNIL